MNLSPDILIIGGGSAGIAAAVGASQNGLSVMMLEKNMIPGGKATSAYVGTVCGIFLTGNGNPVFTVAGFPRDFADMLMKESKTQPVSHAGRLHFIPYTLDAFLSVSEYYLKQHNVDVHYGAQVVSLHTGNNIITQVDCNINGDTCSLHPRFVIDTSGDALSSSLTNSNIITSDQYQAAAQVFAVSGLKDAEPSALNLALARCMRNGIEKGELPQQYERTSVVPGSLINNKVLLKIGIPIAVDHSQISVDRIEKFAKEAVHKIHQYLKMNSEMFSLSSIDFVAPEAGIRTGPRNGGKYFLTGADVLECRKFSDAVARGSWPVEYWAPGCNVEMTYFADNDCYEIPAGCLMSHQYDNLYFGGRNISADDQSIASARVIGTCLQTGYAAGFLASETAQNISFEKTIQLLQQNLFS